MSELLQGLDSMVERMLERLPAHIVLAIPLGVGKPNPLVNALYRRIAADPSRRLTLFTALSLEKPVGHSELEQHFLAPLVERVFKNYPDLDYVKAARAGTLPANIEVHEFFVKTGDYLDKPGPQQHFICTNYSFVTRDMVLQGVNVIAQAVAARRSAAGLRLSLSSNPDLTADLVERMQAAGRPLLTVAMINEELPFMAGEAEVGPDFFDLVLDDPACRHTVFAPPNGSISWADYAIGLHAASLVADGGTLQIGIGSLGDAIAQGLLVRQREPQAYREIMSSLCPQGLAGRELAPLEQGLYGCSEMFVNGFLQLFDAGLLRRRAFPDLCLQQLANAGRLGDKPDGEALHALHEAGRIGAQPDAAQVAWLQSVGLLKAGTPPAGATLERLLIEGWLGPRWLRAPVMHGGFFLGPSSFYQRLHALDEDEMSRIEMSRIAFINELHDDAIASSALKRAQRHKARLMNTTMKVTLLGAAASDALESGQVVSGVGGQYNFIAMGHALPDARAILMLRATHDNRDGLRSNIVWNYGNVTIPRHLRDIVITEYGVADLRGQCDAEVVRRLVEIADSRFQADLIERAQAHGKLPRDYQLPEHARNNRPEALRERLRPWRNSGVLPDFPFGTDLSPDELHIVRTLKKLKHASQHPVELVSLILKSLVSDKDAPPAYLQRLGLDEARGFKDLFVRRLFASNL